MAKKPDDSQKIFTEMRAEIGKNEMESIGMLQGVTFRREIDINTINKRLENDKTKYVNDITHYNNEINATQEHIQQLNHEIIDFEKEIQAKELELEEIKDKFSQDTKKMEEEFVKNIQIKNEENDRLNALIDMITKFKANKVKLQKENDDLEKKLENQKALRIQKIEDKKIDKEKATDKLKKEMLEKIQITKTGRSCLSRTICSEEGAT